MPTKYFTKKQLEQADATLKGLEPFLNKLKVYVLLDHGQGKIEGIFRRKKDALEHQDALKPDFVSCEEYEIIE